MITANLILTLAIIAGQLIKVPISATSGLTILDITVVFLCLLGILKIRLKLKKPPLFIGGALVFIFIGSLSLIFTPLQLEPNEYLISFLYTVRFSSFILLGWLIFSGAFPLLKNNTPRILFYSGLSLAFLGLLQFIFLPDLQFLAKSGWDPHYYRTASTFLDPNFAGAYFTLTLLLLTSYLGGRNGRTPRVLYLTFAIVYIALLTTFSRSSYGMFLISFLSLAFLKKSVKIAGLAVVLFTVLLFSFQIYIRAVNRVTPLDRSETASLRFTTWQQGLEIFQKSPVIGIGFNAYNFALKKYGLGTEPFLEGKGSTYNDSSLLHILATTGILGFIAYFLFLYGLIKSNKSKNLSLIAGIPGLLAHSFFINSLFYPFILIWIILSASNSNDNQTIK